MNNLIRVAVAAALLAAAAPAMAFVTFESGPVRPLAKSPDGNRLFVCNIPDNRLEIFDITAGGLTLVASVPVGLEPVAVAARTNTEVWVVNHLSDSVSVVDVSNIAAPRVTRSLTVGDEPRDIVFGGAAFDHAYISTAHRGQNNPNDPQLSTPGIGRADVWVFDANDLGDSFGGDEKAILSLFGDTPRPLAVSPDGSRVYVGVFLSGNQTMTLHEQLVPDGSQSEGGLPGPVTNVGSVDRPPAGLIVKFDGTQWVDELGRDWSASVRFDLPDYDVFAIDATLDPPVPVAGSAGRFAHVGTTLFNMSVNPADGTLFVSNLEAFNEVRFEGDAAATSVRGHTVESRITIIDPVAETISPRHLNKHIDYDSPFNAQPNATNDKSLAFPLDMAFTSDGTKLYVAAFGSSKLGTYDTSELAADTFVPSTASQIELSGGGPAGIVLDEDSSRLFVLTRFDNSVSIVNTAINAEIGHVALHNPEPASVVDGRPFLYDARFTSSRGDQACASCHPFGDLDALAWDIGDPGAEVLNNPQQFIFGPIGDKDFHPMKGPMLTQSLRGMDNHGPMHWRGDRTGGNDESSSQPDNGNFSEERAFKKFNAAFVGLVGRSVELSTEDMQKFTDFILQVMYPPNPNRALDNSLTADQSAAEAIFRHRAAVDLGKSCIECHATDRSGNTRFDVVRPGFFGTDGRSSNDDEAQHFKVPHLRNLYQNVGMFGMAPVDTIVTDDNDHQGEQVRGFGFIHDGSVDTLFHFFNSMALADATERRQMESFALAFDSNHRPIVGQQATLSPASGVDAGERVDMMLERADTLDAECDVVVKGVVAGEQRGWFYEGSGQFSSDRGADGVVAAASLRALADLAGQELTFTAVPVGEGERIGIDRDLDGFGDADEVDGGSDPTDQLSLPCSSISFITLSKATLLDRRGRATVSADITLASAYAGGVVGLAAVDSGGAIFSDSVAGPSITANSSGSTHSYRAPRGAAGITKLQIKALKTPNTYRVKIKMDKAWTAGRAGETVATTTVTVIVGDECFDGTATDIK